MNEIGHFRVYFKASLRRKPFKYLFSQERFCTQLRLKRESFWNSVGLFHEVNFKTRRTCLTVLISSYLTISSYYLFTISLLILSIHSSANDQRSTEGIPDLLLSSAIRFAMMLNKVVKTILWKYQLVSNCKSDSSYWPLRSLFSR